MRSFCFLALVLLTACGRPSSGLQTPPSSNDSGGGLDAGEQPDAGSGDAGDGEDAGHLDGGDELVIDVPLTRFEFELRMDGGAPVPTAACSSYGVGARVSFASASTDGGFHGSGEVTFGCDGGGMRGSLELIPGPYRVVVQDGSRAINAAVLTSNLGEGGWSATVTVPEDGGSAIFDPHLVPISGRLLLNGAVPTVDPSCGMSSLNAAAKLFLRGQANPPFTITIPCSTTDYSFTASVYPGVYKVLVQLPDNPFNPSADFAGDVPRRYGLPADAELSVPESGALGITTNVERARVTGRLRHNGSDPALRGTCTAPYDSAAVLRWFHFGTGANVNQVDSYEMVVPCDTSDFRFDGLLPPGTWNLWVRSGNAGAVARTDLPGSWGVMGSFTFVAGDNDVGDMDVRTVTVSGKLTLDGGVPVISAAACAPDAGWSSSGGISLLGESGQQYASESFDCSTTDFTFGPLELYPGFYSAQLYGPFKAGSNLPESHELAHHLDLNAPATLTLETALPPGVPVSGNLRINGAIPSVSAGCAENAAYLQFQRSDLVYRNAAIACDSQDFTWSAQLEPGDWSVRIQPGTASDGGLAIAPWPGIQPWSEQFTVTGGNPARDFDLPMRLLKLRLLRNGEPPIATGECSFNEYVGVGGFFPGKGYSFGFPFPCNGPFSGQAWAFPGTYELNYYDVSIEGPRTNLPTYFGIRSAYQVP